jgi:hypothetical protein
MRTISGFFGVEGTAGALLLLDDGLGGIDVGVEGDDGGDDSGSFVLLDRRFNGDV